MLNDLTRKPFPYLGLGLLFFLRVPSLNNHSFTRRLLQSFILPQSTFLNQPLLHTAPFILPQVLLLFFSLLFFPPLINHFFTAPSSVFYFPHGTFLNQPLLHTAPSSVFYSSSGQPLLFTVYSLVFYSFSVHLPKLTTPFLVAFLSIFLPQGTFLNQPLLHTAPSSVFYSSSGLLFFLRVPSLINHSFTRRLLQSFILPQSTFLNQPLLHTAPSSVFYSSSDLLFFLMAPSLINHSFTRRLLQSFIFPQPSLNNSPSHGTFFSLLFFLMAPSLINHSFTRRLLQSFILPQGTFLNQPRFHTALSLVFYSFSGIFLPLGTFLNQPLLPTALSSFFYSFSGYQLSQPLLFTVAPSLINSTFTRRLLQSFFFLRVPSLISHSFTWRLLQSFILLQGTFRSQPLLFMASSSLTTLSHGAFFSFFYFSSGQLLVNHSFSWRIPQSFILPQGTFLNQPLLQTAPSSVFYSSSGIFSVILPVSTRLVYSNSLSPWLLLLQSFCLMALSTSPSYSAFSPLSFSRYFLSQPLFLTVPSSLFFLSHGSF
ncbi:unnamed protein product [Acanthosepion pharaonis]|uniref:Uncharacterized protein n=1 Tax=Acanthosepion pharaonis TaxID=158019 RepID=A0A812DZ66_ACAPH|nr:unnamed protein product [Sepia pharaonis]